MRVLIACELSGVVRNAFRFRGHDAWSCDLSPAADGSPFHYQCDILDLWRKDEGWDLMIAHPPCTHLAVSGARWFKEKHFQQQAAIDFVLMLAGMQMPRIAIENPIGVLSSRWRKPDQIIQPWQFGHPESKATCLWLSGLPKLEPTRVLPMPACGYWSNQTPSRQNKLGPSPTRAQDRSRTYSGIAEAMAEQWGQVQCHSSSPALQKPLPF